MDAELLNEEIIETREAIDLKETTYKLNATYHCIKRIFDIVFSLLALVILLPIVMLIAISITIDSKGPILFRHKRVGQKGKPIFIYKFRTMVPDAEQRIKDFSPEQIKEFKENYKLSNDPRITKIGKFLRKTSLDELPQIINILKGELSFVGPRPVVEEELKKYGDKKEKFISVKPGLTGNWAANGRSCISYAERIKLELEYIDSQCFALDIKILFKTIISVVKREGAK